MVFEPKLTLFGGSRPPLGPPRGGSGGGSGGPFMRGLNMNIGVPGALLGVFFGSKRALFDGF